MGLEDAGPALPWGRRPDGQEQAENAGQQSADSCEAASPALGCEGPHSIEELARFTALREGARIQVLARSWRGSFSSRLPSATFI